MVEEWRVIHSALVYSALLDSDQCVLHSARVTSQSHPSQFSSGLDELAIPDLHEPSIPDLHKAIDFRSA